MPDSAWYLQPERWRGGEGGSKTGALWISMAKMSVASSPPRLRSHDRRMRQLARCYLSCCTQCHPWCCRVPPPMVLHRMTSPWYCTKSYCGLHKLYGILTIFFAQNVSSISSIPQYMQTACVQYQSTLFPAQLTT